MREEGGRVKREGQKGDYPPSEKKRKTSQVKTLLTMNVMLLVIQSPGEGHGGKIGGQKEASKH